MNELKRRWQQVSPRERGLVVGCGVLIILSLCYYALWQPWQQQAEQWQRTIAREKSTVEWMTQQAPRLREQGVRQVQGEPLSLSATVTRSAAVKGMNITRLQPQGERLAVTLEPSDFNPLMQWLTQLEQQYQVRIVALEVTALVNKPGWVTVNKLTLERSDGR
ncbi:type II secretion system protein GspM [Serratia sp. D1N4]